MGKVTLEEFLEDETKKLAAVIKNDLDMRAVLKEKLKDETRYLKGYYDEVINVVNGEKCVDLDYCFLNNIGCGEFSKKSFDSKSYKVNGKYEDPDNISYKMYLYQKSILEEKISGYNIKNVHICQKDYGFKLRLEYSNKTILLSGDWIGNKSFAKRPDCIDVLTEFHKLKGHVFWPAEQNGSKTVNQIRWDKVDIMKTLKALEYWYLDRKCENPTEERLYNAFDAHRDYYVSFGKKKEGFDRYVDFWDIKAFASKEEGKGETELSKQRFELVKKYGNLMVF